ncbi:hypothetical protein ID866_4697 [Astraeus odoratus]|nr:hypothetical protein ID866_4697 [Astraeus odoratus]
MQSHSPNPNLARYVVRSSDVISDLRVNVFEENSDKVIWYKERFLSDEEIIEHVFHNPTSTIQWTIHRPKRGWYIRIRSPAFPPGVFMSVLPVPRSSPDYVDGALYFSCRTTARPLSSSSHATSGSKPSRNSADSDATVVHSYPPTPPVAPIVASPPSPRSLNAKLDEIGPARTTNMGRPPTSRITQFLLAPHSTPHIPAPQEGDQVSLFSRAISLFKNNKPSHSLSFTLTSADNIRRTQQPAGPSQHHGLSHLIPPTPTPLLVFHDTTPVLTVRSPVASERPSRIPLAEMSVAPATMRRLMRELAELKNNPPEGIRVATNEEDMLDVTGIIEGPEGTPYAGGYFRVRFKFTEEFPAAPPKCWFATKIFHPNVSSAGEICVNTLKKDWKSTYGIGHILVTVKCLLIFPNPESALDEEAGKLLLEDYENYCSRAKLITSVHATPRTKPPEFETNAITNPDVDDPVVSSASGPPPPIPLAVPSASSPHKSKSPTPSTQPLEFPSSHTLTCTVVSTSSPTKERVAPSPLSTADSNVAGTANMVATKAVKRSAATGGSGLEKRKKALKRL